MLSRIYFLLLLLLRHPACGSMATSLVAAGPQAKNTSPALLRNPQLSNTTTISLIPDNETLPMVLPYSFSVPNTRTYLRLGFGLVRHRLDPLSLGGLIAYVQDQIVEGINEHGEDSYPGLNIATEEQRFGWALGDGFHFEIHSVRYSGRYFTWRQLRNMVEGLRLFLVVGERPFATRFLFWDGPRAWRWRMGGGGIVVDGAGVGETSELKD